MAQLVARLVRIEKVRGSNPLSSTLNSQFSGSLRGTPVVHGREESQPTLVGAFLVFDVVVDH